MTIIYPYANLGYIFEGWCALRLTKIELRGFKTFADKTTIFFPEDSPVTAIVGPNGCGKSNIVDALRWVIGEQSAKELRGEVSLSEVIFAGTTEKKPLSLAEVTLFLDNADRKLPIDFSEVEVRRRIFRSGESEFLINKSPCRLKDIRDLFLDTGLGVDSYSVITQGQIDAILSSRPEDRRAIFEEAAKISKYRNRKRAAERKLIHTEQNLLRISDLMGEVARELENLRAQAERAQQYKTIKDELRGLEIGVGRRELSGFQKKKEALEVHIGELRSLTSGDMGILDQHEAERERLKSEIRELETKLEAVRSLLEAAIKAGAASHSELLLERERSLNLTARITALSSEVNDIASETDNLNVLLKANEKDIIARQTSHNQVREKLSIKEATVAAIKQNLTILERVAEKLKATIFQHETRLSAERNLVREFEINKKLYEDRQRKINEREDILNRELADSLRRIHALEQEKARHNRAVESAATSVAELAQTRKAKENELARVRAKLTRRKEQYDSDRSRLELLSEMKRNYEGFYQGVREALAVTRQAGFTGACGVLADLIKVPAEYEIAIETALGSKLQAIVTETDSVAKQLIDHLKDQNLGRAHFYALNCVRPPKHIDLPGRRAAEVVSVDAPYRDLIGQLLGDVVLADTLDEAFILLSQSENNFRVVTKAGEWVTTTGLISGGSRAGKVLLAREREIVEFTALLKSTETALADLRNQENALVDSLNTLESQTGQSLTDREAATIQLETVKSTLKQIVVLKAKLESEIKLLQDEKASLESNSRREREEAAATFTAIDNLNRETAALTDELSQKQRAIKAAQEQEGREVVESTELKIATTDTAAQLRAGEEQLRRLGEEKEKLLSRANSKLKEKEESSEHRSAIEASIEKLELAIPAFQTKEIQLKTKMEHLARAKEKLSNQLDTAESKIHSITDEDRILREKLSTEEIKLVKLEGEMNLVLEHLKEEYQLTLAEVLACEYEVANLIEARNRADELRNSARALEPVNLLAIDECTTTAERLEFLKNQSADLYRAKDNLTQLIKELDCNAQSRFLETMEVINRHFGEIFKNLFEGGEARISLSDPDNPLECGIDIMAQPHGKKWLNLSLLSGGERSLTVIAIMFALLKTHPSPFCFLDEADAALDDANIGRFNRLLNEFSRETQIVIITHNKRTMAIAGTLYGITMEELGVSKVVSLKLEKVAN